MLTRFWRGFLGTFDAEELGSWVAAMAITLIGITLLTVMLIVVLMGLGVTGD